MTRLVLLMLAAAPLQAALCAVDIDSAAQVYQAAAIREQVRPALVTMPKQIKRLFTRDASAPFSDEQLAAIGAAAAHGFRIDVFETSALAALAQNLDAETVVRSKQFLASELGRRMVAADVATAGFGEANLDKVMNGELSVPLSAKRNRLIERLERDTHSAESTAQVYLSMAQAVAVGTAIGSGQDPAVVGERATKSAESQRSGVQQELRAPMQRLLAYDYRGLSDADLKHLIEFLESPAGKRYVLAYNAAMEAGYDAMGKRTGEELGESLRELAQAQLDAAPMHAPEETSENSAHPTAPTPGTPGASPSATPH